MLVEESVLYSEVFACSKSTYVIYIYTFLFFVCNAVYCRMLNCSADNIILLIGHFTNLIFPQMDWPSGGPPGRSALFFALANEAFLAVRKN